MDSDCTHSYSQLELIRRRVNSHRYRVPTIDLHGNGDDGNPAESAGIPWGMEANVTE